MPAKERVDSAGVPSYSYRNACDRRDVTSNLIPRTYTRVK